MKKWISIVMFGVVMMALTVSAREYKGVEMPEIIETENTVLVLNGIGERSVFSKTVYLVGLYLQAPEKNWREVIEVDAPMAIQLHVTSAFFASSERIKDAFYKGFRNNMPGGDISSIKDKVDTFNACFTGDINNYDRFDIRYTPGRGTSVYKEGEKIDTIPGYEFKKAVFGIWVGEQPAQESMKEELLAADVAEEALASQKEKMDRIAERQSEARAEAEKQAAEAEKQASEAEADKKKQAAEKQKAAQARLKERFVSEDIYFPLAENQLTGQAKRKLADKVQWLKANPDVRVIIEGHTDNRGSGDTNYELAEKRARQVKQYMVAAGIPEDRMEVISYGEKRPVAEGDNPEAWSRNRRVHFRIAE